MIKNLSIFGLKLASIILLSHFYTSYLYLNSRNQASPIYYKKSIQN